MRDVLDVADLVRHFEADPSFWPELLTRAEATGLGEVYMYTVEYEHPHGKGATLSPATEGKPGWQKDGVQDSLKARADDLVRMLRQS